MFNEGLIGAITGGVCLAGITWTGAWETYSASNLWLAGVVAPAGVSILLVQRLPGLQQAWHKYWQAGEQTRWAGLGFLPHTISLLDSPFTFPDVQGLPVGARWDCLVVVLWMPRHWLAGLLACSPHSSISA